ncbi:MAG: hypothetical protein ABSC77_07070 [Terracidiphilus sp.]
MRPIFFAFSTVLLLSLAAVGQSPASHAIAPAPAAKLEIRPVPLELLQRFEPLHAALQPPAKAWVDQQAKIETQRPKPDLNALRAAIRQRFPRSLASPAPGVSVAEKNRDVDVVAFLVLTESAQQTQADQALHLQKLQEMNTIAQALNQYLKQVTQAAEQLQPKNGNDDNGQVVALNNKPCQTAFCTSLSSRLESLNRASATLPHPLHLQAPANPTVAQLKALVNQMEGALNTVGDDSQLANVDLQNILQHQQQTLQTLSDIEKLMNDTAMSVIRHIGS